MRELFGFIEIRQSSMGRFAADSQSTGLQAVHESLPIPVLRAFHSSPSRESLANLMHSFAQPNPAIAPESWPFEQQKRLVRFAQIPKAKWHLKPF